MGMYLQIDDQISIRQFERVCEYLRLPHAKYDSELDTAYIDYERYKIYQAFLKEKISPKLGVYNKDYVRNTLAIAEMKLIQVVNQFLLEMKKLGREKGLDYYADDFEEQVKQYNPHIYFL
jgi:hypothetical protein